MHSKSHLHTQNSRAGFTLVELLVVIAIVAVLAALTFSVVNRAILKGKQTTCINLMRNVEIGMEAYYMEQNRPPLPKHKDDKDTIFGDPGGLYSTAPLLAILLGDDELTWDESDTGDTFDMSRLNQKRIQYLELTIANSGEAGLRKDGKLYDAWNREMMIAVNSRVQTTDFNNGTADTRLHTFGLAEWADAKPGTQDYVMWTYGADGEFGKGSDHRFAGSDDVKSF